MILITVTVDHYRSAGHSALTTSMQMKREMGEAT